MERGPGQARVLPGRFLRERQTVAAAVADVVRLKLHLAVPVREPRLLKVFDDPARDERAWALSLAHGLVLPHDVAADADGELVPVLADGSLATGESLAYDHDLIVREAASDIRTRYEALPDPDGLLEEQFTLSELRALHEDVLGADLLKDTFNRRMVGHLEPALGSDGRPLTRSAGGRPARVYMRVALKDPADAVIKRIQLPRATTIEP